MRLIAGTKRGIRVLRWIKGERAAGLRARALEAEEIRAAAVRGSAVFVGTGGGKAFLSDDSGASWKPIQEGLKGEAVCSMAVSGSGAPSLFVGTEPAAVFVLPEGAESWSELESFRAMEEAEEWRGYADRRAHVQTIVPDPHAERRLYAGVEVGGAYATDDGGRTWQEIGDGLYEDIHQMAVDPSAGSRMYAATGGGLYLSTNRGLSWSEHAAEVGSLYSTSLLALSDRAGATVLYLATAGGTPATWTRKGAKARLHVSRDGGETWDAPSIGGQRLGKEPYTAIAPDPEDPEGAFVATAGGFIFHGMSSGRRWSTIYRGGEPILTLSVI